MIALSAAIWIRMRAHYSLHKRAFCLQRPLITVKKKKKNCSQTPIRWALMIYSIMWKAYFGLYKVNNCVLWQWKGIVWHLFKNQIIASRHLMSLFFKSVSLVLDYSFWMLHKQINIFCKIHGESTCITRGPLQSLPSAEGSVATEEDASIWTTSLPPLSRFHAFYTMFNSP